MGLLSQWFDSLLSPGRRSEEANERLETIRSIPAAPLRDAPTLTTVAEVNEHERTGDPILVPVVVCSLDVDEAPARDVAYEYVATICRALEPVYRDEHVRHFDVRFRFGPDRFLRSRECRRVTVPPDIVETLSSPDSDVASFRDRIESEDNGDSVTPPVAWGECVSYSSVDETGGAAAAATAGAAAGGGSGGC